jgi:TonB family protein
VVKIEVVIGADGQIKDTKVIGGHPVLVSSALDALKKWKYEPAKTETTATLQFDFRP